MELRAFKFIVGFFIMFSISTSCRFYPQDFVWLSPNTQNSLPLPVCFRQYEPFFRSVAKEPFIMIFLAFDEMSFFIIREILSSVFVNFSYKFCKKVYHARSFHLVTIHLFV